jgi:uncharacterized protein (DUF983 family)
MAETGQRPRFPIMAARALALRCPRCGGGGILRGWFALKHHCPTCDLVFTRGEAGDYWLGGYTINFLVAEFAAVILTVIAVLLTLPDVPWGRVGLVALAAATLLPILCFPFSRTLWLALDLMARPTLRGDRYRYRRPTDAPPRGTADAAGARRGVVTLDDERVFRYVLRHGPVTARAIAAGVGLAPGDVARSVARLVERRLLYVAGRDRAGELLYRWTPDLTRAR